MPRALSPTAGRMLRDYLPTPRTVAPFGTLGFVSSGKPISAP